MLDALGDRDPIQVMKGGFRDLKELVAATSVEKLTRIPAPGEWSAHHVLQHLADTELVYGFRIRMMLTIERPVLTSYDQEAWVDRFSPTEQDPFRALDRLRVLQEANLKIHETMTEEDLDRVGLHSDWGEITVGLILRMLGGHSIVHLEQMKKSAHPLTPEATAKITRP